MGLFSRKSKAPVSVGDPALADRIAQQAERVDRRPVPRQPQQQEPTAATTDTGATYRISGKRWAHIVHMRNHGAHIKAILDESGQPADDDPAVVAFGTTATLVREPHHRTDPNAVAVVIGGKKVGYLAKADAHEMAPKLDAILATGKTPVTGARIERHADHHAEFVQNSQIMPAVPEFSGVVRL